MFAGGRRALLVSQKLVIWPRVAGVKTCWQRSLLTEFAEIHSPAVQARDTIVRVSKLTHLVENPEQCDLRNPELAFIRLFSFTIY